MPGINEVELAAIVAHAHPSVRILFATGYEHVDVDEGMVLRKPFGVSELARRVRSELDRPDCYF